LAGVVMFGMAGSWWLVRSLSPPSDQAQAASLADSGSQTSGEPAAPSELADQNSALEEHFGYVFHNGQPLSPEFQNAAQALNDLKENRAKAAEADRLNLPELDKSQKILEGVTLEAPLPQKSDILSLRDLSALSEPICGFELSAPNLKLLAPASPPKPLTVEKVMDLLNEEQERRAQSIAGPALPSASQFFGHPTESVNR
jgi:hypothetical protein